MFFYIFICFILLSRDMMIYVQLSPAMIFIFFTKLYSLIVSNQLCYDNISDSQVYQLCCQN